MPRASVRITPSTIWLADLPPLRAAWPQTVASAGGEFVSASAQRPTREAPHLVWPEPIGSGPMPLPSTPQMPAEANAEPQTPEVPRLPRGVVLSLPVAFTARPEAYARLWLKNLLLTLLTLGLYLPWARVHTQRFFMRHTMVAGHRLDYHATPQSLLPRYGLCLSLLLGVAGAWAGSTVAGMLALSLALAVWPLVVYMSLVHRMAHISWDRRRLAFVGPCQGVYRALWAPLAASCVLAWALLGVLAWHRPAAWLAWGMLAALWLMAMPAFATAWLLYRQRHFRIGPLNLVWQADRRSVYRLSVRTLVWAGLASLVVLGASAMWVGAVRLLKGHWGAANLSAVAALGTMLALAAVWPYAQARLQNLVWCKTGSRYLRFRSRLSVSGYVLLQLRHLLLLGLTGGLYWPWAVVASRRMRTEALTVWTRVDADVLKSRWPTHAAQMQRRADGDTACQAEFAQPLRRRA
jgi:uncharacterized membrane protein YjgN (DUF898 family)